MRPPVKLPLNTANLLLTPPPWDVIQVRNFCMTYVPVRVTTQFRKAYIAQHMADDQPEHSVPNYVINFECTFPFILYV